MGNGDNDLESRLRLERAFEDLTTVFGSSNVPDASSNEVLLVFDTNVLLLPYTIRKDSLPKLQNFYEKLLREGRLYLPARAAREFINNRDKKLAELLKTFSDVKSKINIGETRLSPILEGVDGSNDLSKASEALGEAKKKYVSAISLLEKSVRSWSGNDPVTKIYSREFSEENMISPPQTKEELVSEWDKRRSNSVPPGYKDETGIRDFLIRKTILLSGRRWNWNVRQHQISDSKLPSQINTFRIEKGQRLYVRDKNGETLSVVMHTANKPEMNERFVIALAGAIFDTDKN